MSEGFEFHLTKVDPGLLGIDGHPRSLSESVYNYASENPGKTAAIVTAAIFIPIAASRAPEALAWAERVSGLNLTGNLGSAALGAEGSTARTAADEAANATKNAGENGLPKVTIEEGATPPAVTSPLQEKSPRLLRQTSPNQPNQKQQRLARMQLTLARNLSLAQEERSRQKADDQPPALTKAKMNSGLWMREPENKGFVEWLTGRAKVGGQAAEAGEKTAAEKLEAIAKPVNDDAAKAAAKLDKPAEPIANGGATAAKDKATTAAGQEETKVVKPRIRVKAGSRPVEPDEPPKTPKWEDMTGAVGPFMNGSEKATAHLGETEAAKIVESNPPLNKANVEAATHAAKQPAERIVESHEASAPVPASEWRGAAENEGFESFLRKPIAKTAKTGDLPAAENAVDKGVSAASDLPAPSAALPTGAAERIPASEWTAAPDNQGFAGFLRKPLTKATEAANAPKATAEPIDWIAMGRAQ